MLRSQAVLYDSSHDVRTIESAVVADLLQTLLSGKRLALQAAEQSSGRIVGVDIILSHSACWATAVSKAVARKVSFFAAHRD